VVREDAELGGGKARARERDGQRAKRPPEHAATALHYQKIKALVN